MVARVCRRERESSQCALYRLHFFRLCMGPENAVTRLVETDFRFRRHVRVMGLKPAVSIQAL